MLQTTKKALIIGGGVSGLTVAMELLSLGFQVEVWAAVWNSESLDTTNYVSDVAGALWEYPPAVCGYHRDEDSLERSKVWAIQSYNRFQHITKTHPESGVKFCESIFTFTKPVDDPEYSSLVLDYKHDSSLIQQNGINPHGSVDPSKTFVDAFAFSSPVVDMSLYVPWLKKQVLKRGAKLVTRQIHGCLYDINPAYFPADVVINCSGLGARTLVGDEKMYPLRGQLVRVRNPGVKGAFCVANEEHVTQQNMIYIIPRHNTLILGGIAQPDDWTSHPRPDGTVQDILTRCRNFLPILRNAELDASYETMVGLRPARHGGVRLEMEFLRSQTNPRIVVPLIHNYGHGGSGMSFSWGCAKEVGELAQQGIATAQTQHSKL